MPILTIVLNNACWGMSQNGQDLVFGANRRAAVTLSDTNYDAVAAAFGGYGERVDRYEDVAPAVKRALASGKPACINLIIDADIVHPITVSMVGDVSAEDQISIPYYENIPLAAAEPLKPGG
jgi:acetolactate synthase-1/2/3 large subunit